MSGGVARFWLGLLFTATFLMLLEAVSVASAQRLPAPTPIPRMATPTPLCDTSGLILDLDAEELSAWSLINAYREANGAARLVWTPSLVKASLWMANEISYMPTPAHNDRTGRGPFGRMPDCGYTASPIMGENLAWGYVTGQQVFNGWRNSPGHNYVMLLPDFRVGGIARVQRAGSAWSYFWALDLGGAAEPIGLTTVHPETTWRWTCRNNLCERIMIGE